MRCVPRHVFLGMCLNAGIGVRAAECVVSQDAENVCFDAGHEIWRSTPAAQNAGPGTELKKLLAGWPFRISITPNCSCTARAAEMDRRGLGWCEGNIETIVGWLREEAAKRGLPFLDAAGRLLVRRAITNARRAAS